MSTTLYITEKTVPLGNYHPVTDASGNLVYALKQKGAKSVFYDNEKCQLGVIKQGLSLVVPKFTLYLDSGESLTVKQKFGLAIRYEVEGLPWLLQSTATGYEYQTLERDHIAYVERTKPGIHPRYRVEVLRQEDVLSCVGITLTLGRCISAISK